MTVVITYLEMRDPAELRAAPAVPGAALRRVQDAALNRWFYETIGADWQWVDRLYWTDAQWGAYAATVETLVLHVAGQPAGYAELRREPPRDVKIAMLGLLRSHHGRGLGGMLVTEAVRAAWAMPGTRRVWLHTCTLDGPHALRNYRARGFSAFRRHAG